MLIKSIRSISFPRSVLILPVDMLLFVILASGPSVGNLSVSCYPLKAISHLANPSLKDRYQLDIYMNHKGEHVGEESLKIFDKRGFVDKLIYML